MKAILTATATRNVCVNGSVQARAAVTLNFYETRCWPNRIPKTVKH